MARKIQHTLQKHHKKMFTKYSSKKYKYKTQSNGMCKTDTSEHAYMTLSVMLNATISYEHSTRNSATQQIKRATLVHSMIQYVSF